MITSIVSFIVIIAVCVIVHEYGHYRTALASGIQIHEFAFGMGPVLTQIKGKNNLWSVRLFPVGGFVRLAGMDEEEETEQVIPGMGFQDKSPWRRLAVIGAGPAANVILALVLTAGLLAGYGVLDMDSPRVGETIPGYPAEQNGIREGDLIVSVNGVKVSDWNSMAENIRNHRPELPLSLRIIRDGQPISLSVMVPADEASGLPLLGIKPSRITFPIHQALWKSAYYTFHMSVEMIRGIGSWIFGRASVDVSGPVGIAFMAGEAARQGIWSLISFMAIISLNLGIVNLIPFPALDGGRIAFIIGEIATGKKLPQKVEGYIHFTGFVVLIGLIALVTWKDIVRVFN